MEDILASIRKILNEEEAAPPSEAAPTARPVPAPQPAPNADPEPLELTEAMLVAPPADAAALALPERPPEPAVNPALPPPPVQAALPEPSPEMRDDGLVAPATAAAAAALIGQLARTVAAERTAPVHRGGPSIEDVVREEVRPMLKAWMDAHLPTLVERLVRTEIERVVSRSLG
ncbi:DUF2497 domain-containing protein [Roseomonas sp. SG15]|uniref:DUF2497 domain-containing protein n=2 Tax=Roseomonas indoligenes TaxID=2820811 RepID=A0A940N241_9PROT|nr:DUF2497 domain-containing protein [Pararoseomonas indoligenes]